MITPSAEARELMRASRPFEFSVTITLTSGNTISLSEDDMCATGCKIIISPGSSSFPVGNAISRCLTLCFYNIDDQYEDVSFYGATVAVYARLTLSQIVETYDLGQFTVTEPEEYGTNISITAYDNFYRADSVYETNISFPVSAQALFTDVCSKSSLIPYSSNFTNNNYIIRNKPEGMSCRQVIGLISMLAGGNAIVDGDYVKIVEWDKDAMSFIDPAGDPTNFHKLDEKFSQTVSTDNVVITGVTIKHSDNEYTVGNSGYVLVLENTLTDDNELDAANRLGSALIGLTFRPFQQTTASYPFAEFGDMCVLYNGENYYKSVITDVEFNFKGITTLQCSADSPIRNTSKSYTAQSKTYQYLHKLIVEEKSQRELAEEDLSDRLAAGTGLYLTTQTTPDGDIYYLHDKQDLASSRTVIKMTAEAFGVSTDGGETWNAGLTVDGTLLAKILSADGVNADWINTGRLAVSDALGNDVFYADLDTKSVYISGDRVFIGRKSAADILAEITGALTISLSNEMQGVPVDENGDYDVFPNVSTEIRVIYGGTDVTDSCSLNYGEFAMSGTLEPKTGYYLYTAHDLVEDTGYATFTATYNTGTEIVQGTKQFALYKAYKGQTGADGSARTFFVESNATVIKQGVDEAFVPATVTFNAYYRDGTVAERYPYTGLFKIEITKDGTNWETVVEPEENKTSQSYTLTDKDTAAVKCTLYAIADLRTIYYGLWKSDTDIIGDDDGSILEIDHKVEPITGGEQVDIQTAAVVRDVSALTQDNVYDILTNGGQDSGLWLDQGHLYLNADYMGLGILRSRATAADAPETRWNLETGEFVIRRNGNVIFRISTTSNGVDIVASNFSLTSGATIDSIAQSRANAALTSANGYTDTAASNTLNSANSHADDAAGSALTSAQAYARQEDAKTLQNAKNYVNNQDYATSSAAQQYSRDAASSAVNGQSQLFVFNKLTKNGTVQGITMNNGELYINAGFINAGTLNAARIGALSIATGHLAADAVTSPKIKAGEVKAVNIATDAVTADKIRAGSVTASKITTDNIEGTYGWINLASGTFRFARNTNLLAWNGSTLSIQGAMQSSTIGSSTINSSTLNSSTINLLDANRSTGLVLSGQQISFYYNNADANYKNGGSIRAYGREYGMEYQDFYDVEALACDIDVNANYSFNVIARNMLVAAFSNYQVSIHTDLLCGKIKPRYNTTLTIEADKLEVSGTKHRVVTTEDYGKRLLYSYETPSPYFGDIGEGVIGEDGMCYVRIDPTFAETITTSQYQVFLQKYGDGDCYVEERKPAYFVVSGTPDLAFGWEMKAKQSDFDQLRLEKKMGEVEQDPARYPDLAIEHIQEIQKERSGDAA